MLFPGLCCLLLSSSGKSFFFNIYIIKKSIYIYFFHALLLSHGFRLFPAKLQFSGASGEMLNFGVSPEAEITSVPTNRSQRIIQIDLT